VSYSPLVPTMHCLMRLTNGVLETLQTSNDQGTVRPRAGEGYVEMISPCVSAVSRNISTRQPATPNHRHSGIGGRRCDRSQARKCQTSHSPFSGANFPPSSIWSRKLLTWRLNDPSPLAHFVILSGIVFVDANCRLLEAEAVLKAGVYVFRKVRQRLMRWESGRLVVGPL